MAERSPRRRPSVPLPNSPVQSVFSIGQEPGTLDELQPIFSDFSIQARRIVTGELALEQLRHTVPDLVIVEHPLPDMPTPEFVTAIRDRVRGSLTIILLTPMERTSELEALAAEGEIVLPSDGPREEFLEAAKSFLRRDRRTPCAAMVRLSVALGDSRLLRLAQAVNLSRKGLLVRTSEDLPLGADVFFEIFLTEKGEPIRGSARTVRHVRSHESQILGVGLEFLEVRRGDQERLLTFIDSQAG